MVRPRRRTGTALVAVLGTAAVVMLGACSDDGGSDASPADAVELSAAGEEGRAVAEDQGCNSCHQVDGDDGIGPSWTGLAGSEVELDDGTVVVADEEYLTRSIVEPGAQIVKGYNNIMPVRALDDDQVAAIVTYLQELGTTAD